MGVIRRLPAIGAIACLVIGCGNAAPPPPGASSVSIAPAADAACAGVIAKYQARIPELMAEQGIPGLELAVVDGDHVLWAQAFGIADKDRGAPVTLDTIFSVQSMSKLFTATAAMRAVQEGRLDLDVPITRYLPDFTVHSAFESHPEQKMTLRMLLSHTAGFTHEAPVGNNYELDPGTFDQHVASISDTWLRFPVGTGYAYSNLGIDLAGYILEKVYGKPIAAVMEDEVLGPIGMDHSTFDRDRIHASADRATGYTGMGIPSPTTDVAMTAAGGLYATAPDLARFLEFELGDGSIGGTSILDPALLAEQRTIPAPNAGAQSGYALGVIRTRWRAERFQDLFTHDGGGYGFLSDLWWAPGTQIGIAILTNSSEHHLQGDLAISILRDFVDTPGSVFQQRLLGLPYQSNAVDLDTAYQAPAGMATLIANLAMPATPDRQARWATYEGKYKVASMGVITPGKPPSEFLVQDGAPIFVAAADDGTLTRHPLTELQAGLFITDDGQTLDFRGPQPTWRSLDLVRVSSGPALWQWLLLLLGAVVAMGWFLATIWAAVRRRRRGEPAPDGLGRRALVTVLATLVALLTLANVALIAAIPDIVDSGFLGWLHLPMVLRLLLHVPLFLAIAAVGLALVAVGSALRTHRPVLPRRDLAIGLAGIVVAGQLAAWHLVGWGLT